MPRYFEFEVALEGVTPRIWRRFLLHGEDSTFFDLHVAIQMACGWEDSHLFEFRQGQTILAGPPPDEELGFGVEGPDAEDVLLLTHFKMAKDACRYVYDFGDDWHHEVTLKQIVIRPSHFEQKLLAGKRAFPPEDSGGIPGYERLLTVLLSEAPPAGEAEESLLEWIGGWDPEAFDLEEAAQEFDM